jgi:hypothetical protein
MQKGTITWSTVLSLALLAVIAVMAIYPGKTIFAGSHTMILNRTSPTYGDTQFCWKCHASQVVNVTSSGNYTAHNSTVCICHGYLPNYTQLSGPYGKHTPRTINLKHNLTMDIYCTNCHTEYNESDAVGAIVIYSDGTKTENQSAHYIYFNGSDSTSIEKVYNRSWRYFNRSFGTP